MSLVERAPGKAGCERMCPRVQLSHLSTSTDVRYFLSCAQDVWFDARSDL